MKTNPNEPINSRPYSHDERPSGGFEGDRVETFQAFTGLTKREYFAVMALQGLLANNEMSIQFAIKYSVSCADGLISELNKSE